MLTLCFIFGFIAGVFFGICIMAVMMLNGRYDHEIPEKHYCRECDHPVPGDEGGCYWCEIQDCDVWPFTEACEHFTNTGRK